MAGRRHNYEYDVDPASDTAPANVLRLVGQRKRVLEIGCGPGSITKLLSSQNDCSVTALELDPEAIEKASPYCQKIFQADLNSAEWPTLLNGEDRFDVVVAADVLEHLYDPWITLERMVDFLNPEGYLVISLPHVGHAAIASCLFNGDFQYRDWGLLDRTHIRFFGLKNIEDLFSRAGLKLIEARYVIKPPQDTEFAASWSALPGTIQNALNSSPHAHVYQVVVKAVPLERPQPAVSLVLLSPLRQQTMQHRTLKARVGRHLSPQLKQFIRKSFGVVGIKF
ncbi:Ubiquinone biosynthesis O-methyltransferase [compost metagenome]